MAIAIHSSTRIAGLWISSFPSLQLRSFVQVLSFIAGIAAAEDSADALANRLTTAFSHISNEKSHFATNRKVAQSGGGGD